MNYPSSYSGDAVIDVDYVDVVQPPQDAGQLLSWHSKAAARRTVEKAVLATTRDQCLAALTKTGMERIAAFSAMEQQASKTTPQCAARLRELVDAYAEQVTDTIRRW